MQATQHAYKGAILNAVGFLFLALASAGVKHISVAVPIIVIVFFQSLISLFLTLPLLFKYGIYNLKTSHISPLFMPVFWIGYFGIISHKFSHWLASS